MFSKLGVGIAPPHPPSPVTAWLAGAIHTCLRAETKQILHLHDRHIGGTAKSQLCHCAGRVRSGRRTRIISKPATCFGIEYAVPARHCVVVVCRRIDDAFAREAMREFVLGRRRVEERGLQNSHSDQPEMIAKMIDVGIQVAEILCDEGQRTEFAAEGRKQFVAGGASPLPGARVTGITQDLKDMVETHEVVNPNHVESLKRRSDTIYPPRPVLVLVRRPIVVGVPPKLPFIDCDISPDRTQFFVWIGDRRYPSQYCRLACSVKTKKIRTRLDVGATGCAKERKVADKIETSLMSMSSEPAPLAIEDELKEGVIQRIPFGLVAGATPMSLPRCVLAPVV